MSEAETASAVSRTPPMIIATMLITPSLVVTT